FLVSRVCALPRPTLCPYTPLFRSRRERDDVGQHRRHVPEREVHAKRPRDAPGTRQQVEGERARPRIASPQEDRGVAKLLRHLVRDRKSTRLNSSHVKISYAVFCLK